MSFDSAEIGDPMNPRDQPRKISFRPLDISDSDRLFRWRNMEQVSAFMYSNDPISREQHDQWLPRTLTDPSRRYWIIEHDGPIGLINLYDIDTKNSRAGWAYYIGETEMRGRGISKACDTFIKQQAFDVLGLHKLTCEVMELNHHVCSIHQRNGFIREGFLRDHVRRKDGFHNVIVYGYLNK